MRCLQYITKNTSIWLYFIEGLFVCIRTLLLPILNDFDIMKLLYPCKPAPERALIIIQSFHVNSRYIQLTFSSWGRRYSWRPNYKHWLVVLWCWKLDTKSAGKGIAFEVWGLLMTYNEEEDPEATTCWAKVGSYSRGYRILHHLKWSIIWWGHIGWLAAGVLLVGGS